jgi:hypothetical protein
VPHLDGLLSKKLQVWKPSEGFGAQPFQKSCTGDTPLYLISSKHIMKFGAQRNAHLPTLILCVRNTGSSRKPSTVSWQQLPVPQVLKPWPLPEPSQMQEGERTNICTLPLLIPHQYSGLNQTEEPSFPISAQTHKTPARRNKRLSQSSPLHHGSCQSGLPHATVYRRGTKSYPSHHAPKLHILCAPAQPRAQSILSDWLLLTSGISHKGPSHLLSAWLLLTSCYSPESEGSSNTEL